MRVRSPFTLLFVLGILLALTACGGGGTGGSGNPLGYGEFPMPDGPGDVPPGGTPPDPGGTDPLFPSLTGGVLVTIDTQGETWRWWVTNPVTASYLERAWKGTFSGRFGGVLRDGPGEAGHNGDWSWHVDPDENSFDYVFLVAPSGGPGTPSQCENDLARWLSKHTLFIAYPFNIVAFDDRRP